MKRLAITICALLIAATAMAKDNAPAVSVKADKRSVLIGDRIIYTIDVRAGKGIDVQVPDFKDGKMGEFEIRDRKRELRKGFFGRESAAYIFDISIFSTGNKIIPAAEIKYKDKGEWKTVKTKELPVAVASLLPKGKPATDIRDIKGPLYFREVNWVLVFAAVIFLSAAGAAVWIYVCIRRRKAIKLPHETALEELEAMKGELARTGDIKRYYVGISDAIRNYIERRFDLKAPEMTTEEFFDSMRESETLTIGHKRLLREFLASCDFVKFARYSPRSEEMDSVFATARNFIEETSKVLPKDKES